MNLKKLLGKKIKQYRILRGLSQEKFSEMLNISQRTLSGIECGNNFVTSQTLEKMMEVLEISPDDLFHMEYLKDPKELIIEITNIIKKLEKDEEKLRLIYKIIQVIVKD